MLQDEPENVTAGYAFGSSDGGATWRRTLFDNTTRWVSEESCAFSPDGSAFLVDGASDYYDGIPRHELGHLRVFESRDRGRSWVKEWTRREGWVDWTYLGFASTTAPHLVIFGNEATDRLGHFLALRPVALVSEGTTFRGPFAPAPGQLVNTTVWTGGSATLSDGTALFSATVSGLPRLAGHKPGAWWLARLSTGFFAVESDGRVTARAEIPIRKGWTSFVPSLARDESSGRYHGRLYSVWAENKGSASEIRLARSDDNGFRWSSRVLVSVMPNQCSPSLNPLGPSYLWNPRIAVNRSGTVGVTWIEGRGLLRFAGSSNGAETFNVPTNVVAPQPRWKRWEALGDTVPFDEYTLAEDLAVYENKPFVQYGRIARLGLTVRLSRDTSLSDSGIAVGRGDDFDLFWSAPELGGGHSLWMTSMSGSMRRTHTFARLAAAPCAGNPRLPPAAVPRPALSLPAWLGRDISGSFGINPLHTTYDARNHNVAVTIFMDDRRKRKSTDSLWIVASDLHSDFGRVIAQNATGFIRGYPYWRVPATRRIVLQLRFNVSRFRDDLQAGMEGALVGSELRVYYRNAAANV